MIPVPTERPDADAPVPQDGTEQAAAERAAAQQPAPQQPAPAEESNTAEIVGDIADVVGSIILGLLDD